MTRVLVAGSTGKMGQLLVDEVRAAAASGIPGLGGLTLGGGLERAGHPRLGEELAPGIARVGDPDVALAGADVYIDFTAPAATVALAEHAARLGVAGVIGTTGLDVVAHAALRRAAERIPLVVAPNFSLGVAVLCDLAARAARALPGFDLEVVELHHKHKRDAPSGTALAVADALARGRGLDPAAAIRPSRAGDVGPRPAEEIGVFAVRGGDVIGEHTAYLLGPAERIELTHRATDRRIFARGAVRAAAWVAGRRPGLYGIRDVLGLDAP